MRTPKQYYAELAALDAEETELREALAAQAARPVHEKTKAILKDIRHRLMVVSRKKGQLPLPDVVVKKERKRYTAPSDLSGFFDLKVNA